LTYEGIDKTFHLAGEAFFSALKPGAVFVNAARGAVVDSTALKRARDAGRLQAVVLDVWENEPNIDLEMVGRVDIGTPHIAGYSLDGKIAGLIMIYKSLCRHFDVPPKFDITDFLPPPDVPRLDMEATEAADEELAAQAVRQVYDIVRDDGDLRRITTEGAESRGRFFDALRKEYPVRREFHNTTVVLSDKQGSVARKLQGIGFRVEGGGQDAAR
jgi:erythronate-4-phosphate dehydrogenase